MWFASGPAIKYYDHSNGALICLVVGVETSRGQFNSCSQEVFHFTVYVINHEYKSIFESWLLIRVY